MNATLTKNERERERKSEDMMSALIYGSDLWKWHCCTCMDFKLFNTIQCDHMDVVNGERVLVLSLCLFISTYMKCRSMRVRVFVHERSHEM